MTTNDPLAREGEIVRRVRGNPAMTERLRDNQDVVLNFVRAKQDLQVSIVAQDPLGMAGPQTLTPEQERLANAYERALDELDRLTREEGDSDER